MTKATQEKLPPRIWLENPFALWDADMMPMVAREETGVCCIPYLSLAEHEELIRQAKAEAFEEIVVYCGHPDAAEACRIILAKAKAARALLDTAE